MYSLIKFLASSCLLLSVIILFTFKCGILLPPLTRTFIFCCSYHPETGLIYTFPPFSTSILNLPLGTVTSFLPFPICTVPKFHVPLSA